VYITYIIFFYKCLFFSADARFLLPHTEHTMRYHERFLGGILLTQSQQQLHIIYNLVNFYIFISTCLKKKYCFGLCASCVIIFDFLREYSWIQNDAKSSWPFLSSRVSPASSTVKSNLRFCYRQNI